MTIFNRNWIAIDTYPHPRSGLPARSTQLPTLPYQNSRPSFPFKRGLFNNILNEWSRHKKCTGLTQHQSMPNAVGTFIDWWDDWADIFTSLVSTKPAAGFMTRAAFHRQISQHWRFGTLREKATGRLPNTAHGLLASAAVAAGNRQSPHWSPTAASPQRSSTFR
jgi:hypothetical protein